MSLIRRSRTGFWHSTRTVSLRIAAPAIIRVSRRHRIPHSNRRKPVFSAPAVRDRRPPRQRLRLPVRDPAYGHGTQHQKHGRFSRPRAKASVHVMFQTSVDNQPGKRREPTAFPEVRHGHRIVVAPPHLVRPRQRHRTVAAVPDARISIDSVPGIWLRITAPAPSARAVRQ